MLRVLALNRTFSIPFIGGAVALCACLLLLSPALNRGAQAATLEEKQSDARDRIERTSSEIEAGKADFESAQEEADKAAGEEAELTGLLVNGQERSAALTSQLREAEAALAQSRKRLRKARGLLAERLVAIYMQGGTPDNLEIAFGVGSFDELASGTEYLTAIQNSSDRLMERVDDLRRRLDGKVDGLGEAREAVEEHNAALSSARDRIASVRAGAESSAAALASVNSERESQISSLKSDIQGWQKQIEKREEVSAEQAEEEVDRNLGGPYSIPTYIVMCESGGNYSALNPSSMAGGAYQIIPSTWKAYGGKGQYAHEASKAEQDRVAGLIWAASGASPWVCG